MIADGFVELGDTQSLRKVLTEEISQPAIMYRKRFNAFQAGHECYDCSVVAKQWKELFDAMKYQGS